MLPWSSEEVLQSPTTKPEIYQNFEVSQEDTDILRIDFEMNGKDEKVTVRKTMKECKDFQMKLDLPGTQVCKVSSSLHFLFHWVKISKILSYL